MKIKHSWDTRSSTDSHILWWKFNWSSFLLSLYICPIQKSASNWCRSTCNADTHVFIMYTFFEAIFYKRKTFALSYVIIITFVSFAIFEYLLANEFSVPSANRRTKNCENHHQLIKRFQPFRKTFSHYNFFRSQFLMSGLWLWTNENWLFDDDDVVHNIWKRMNEWIYIERERESTLCNHFNIMYSNR